MKHLCQALLFAPQEEKRLVDCALPVRLLWKRFCNLLMRCWQEEHVCQARLKPQAASRQQWCSTTCHVAFGHEFLRAKLGMKLAFRGVKAGAKCAAQRSCNLLFLNCLEQRTSPQASQAHQISTKSLDSAKQACQSSIQKTLRAREKKTLRNSFQRGCAKLSQSIASNNS